MQKSSPLFFHRYELKYHIPFYLVNELRHYIESYCSMDPYSEDEPDNFYTINNLYLDTSDYILLRRRLNKEDRRFNLRIRAYGDGTFAPYFLEVKYKQNGKVQKYRHPLKLDEWKQFSHNADQYIFPAIDETIREKYDNYNKFESIIQNIWARPQIQTQYKRLAYFSNYDDYARITFDKELLYKENSNYDFVMGDMQYYDHNQNFELNNNVILELKCTTSVPSWFLDLIKVFNLERNSFSKYAGAMLDMLPGEQSEYDFNVESSLFF